MPAPPEKENPVLALDIGATTTRAALVGDGGEILGMATAPTPCSGDSAGLVTRHLAGLIRQLPGSTGVPSPAAIGISACGPVDHRRGSVVRPPNLPFAEIPLVDPLGDEFGIPVRLANDCHAGVLGEVAFGAGAGCRDLVYITLSTGIGGGVVSGGRLVLGRDGNAAEIGHFHVDDTWNLPCGCGGTGHWEGYASGRFLPRFYDRWCEIPDPARIRDRPGGRGGPLDRISDPIGVRDRPGGRGAPLGRIPGLGPAETAGSAAGIFSAARGGDPAARGFLGVLGEVNGRGISDVIVAYDPSRIILDGSVILRNEDLILPYLLPHVDRFLPLPEIRLTALDGLAPLLGASVLARGYDTVIGSLLPG
jgi:glucokinase